MNSCRKFCIFPSIILYLSELDHILKTRTHVAQGGFNLSMYVMIILKSYSNFFDFPSDGITVMYYNVWSINHFFISNCHSSFLKIMLLGFFFLRISWNKFWSYKSSSLSSSKIFLYLYNHLNSCSLSQIKSSLC